MAVKSSIIYMWMSSYDVIGRLKYNGHSAFQFYSGTMRMENLTKAENSNIMRII